MCKMVLVGKVADASMVYAQVVPRLPQDNPTVAALYERWVGAPVGSEQGRQLFFTEYHKRNKSIAATVGDW